MDRWSGPCIHFFEKLSVAGAGADPPSCYALLGCWRRAAQREVGMVEVTPQRLSDDVIWIREDELGEV